MTVNTNENQAQNQQNTTPSDKELNFRRQEQMYQRMLAEKEARLKELEQIALQKQQQSIPEDEEDDSEPYVDKKKLSKTLNKFGQSTKSEIEKAMELAKQKAKEEVKQELWLEQNGDFYDVLQHAEKFAQMAPGLANTILKMPEGFERQKLVYENIKALGLHKPQEKQSTIQEKIENNRKSPYYQPSGIGTSPYAATSDFSQAGQQQAYQKMKELQNKLRI